MHAVELVSLVGFRRHVEAGIAGEPGRNDGPLVVEKGKPFVIAGRVRDQYASIARQALLQALQQRRSVFTSCSAMRSNRSQISAIY